SDTRLPVADIEEEVGDQGPDHGRQPGREDRMVEGELVDVVADKVRVGTPGGDQVDQCRGQWNAEDDDWQQDEARAGHHEVGYQIQLPSRLPTVTVASAVGPGPCAAAQRT